MKICYIDESGCLGMMPTATVDITPAFIISALFIDHANLSQITNKFLDFKQRSFLKHSGLRWHDCMRTEIKGSALRKDVRNSDKATRRIATNFLNNIIALLEQNDAKLVARVYVKEIGKPLNGKAVYTSAIQWICEQFQHYLFQTASVGIIIADAREKSQNSLVSHSIFTRKFKRVDAYPDMVEMPIFGHAENHAGLQISDIICSGLLFPFTMHSYCTGFIQNCHVNDNYKILKSLFSQRLFDLQYTYVSGDGKVGGRDRGLRSPWASPVIASIQRFMNRNGMPPANFKERFRQGDGFAGHNPKWQTAAISVVSRNPAPKRYALI